MRHESVERKGANNTPLQSYRKFMCAASQEIETKYFEVTEVELL